MEDTVDNIRKSLIKRQKALEKFEAQRAAYLHAKEQITWEINEARNIWITMEEQLPKREFKD